MPVPILKVAAETPESDHGDTADKPIPAPKATSKSVSAAAAAAPAATAAQETPEPRRSISDVGLVLIAVSIGYLAPLIRFWSGRGFAVRRTASHSIDQPQHVGIVPNKRPRC